MADTHPRITRLEISLELRLPPPGRHATLIAAWLRRVARVIERGDPPCAAAAPATGASPPTAPAS